MRNPFRFTLQPGTEEIYFGDVGWNTWEEVNHGVAGTNFGWPCYEGNGPQPFFQSDFRGGSVPLTSPVTPPFYTYDHSSRLRGDRRPVLHRHGLSAAVPGQLLLRRLHGQLHQAGGVRRQPPPGLGAAVRDRRRRARSRSPSVPTGCIYYLSFTTGEIRRIRFNGPVAEASATTPTNGYSPLTVSFSSAGSSDPGGGQLSYLWDFGDGTTSTAANPSHTYTVVDGEDVHGPAHRDQPAGAVVDGHGRRHRRQHPTDADASPRRSDGTTVFPGQTVTYQGRPPTRTTGTLGPSALRWTVLLHHNTHVHTFVGGTGARGSFVAEDHGDIGTFCYEIILDGDRQQRAEVQHQRQPPGRRRHLAADAPTGLTATAAGPVR